MEAYRIENLTFAYPTAAENALCGVSLEVSDGSFTVLCGESGSGKSTLLGLMKPSVSPFGKRSGDVLFGGADVFSDGFSDVCIGFVSQNPDNTLVTDRVKTELAFGLESVGEEPSAIRRRVAEICAFFGIEGLYERYTSSLSGGEKQLTALASVLCMRPKALLLDEPLSQLDPVAASAFCDTLARINRELGITVVISEHRLSELLPMADKVVVLEKGKVIFDGDPTLCPAALKKAGSAMFGAMPEPAKIYVNAGFGGECPLDIASGRRFVASLTQKEREALYSRYTRKIPNDRGNGKEELAVKLRGVYFRYEKNSDDILAGLDLEVKKSSHTCILGSNGTGKSTLLSVITGEFAPICGSVKRDKGLRFARLPQSPLLLFTENSVREDFLTVCRDEERIAYLSDEMKIMPLLKSHPGDLSGGELQRAAICKLLFTNPDVLLLDEPTKGMDFFAKSELGGVIRTLTENGRTVVTVSHDVEFCAEYADECVMLFRGKAVCEDIPERFFGGNFVYTTAKKRLFHGEVL